MIYHPEFEWIDTQNNHIEKDIDFKPIICW